MIFANLPVQFSGNNHGFIGNFHYLENCLRQLVFRIPYLESRFRHNLIWNHVQTVVIFNQWDQIYPDE